MSANVSRRRASQQGGQAARRKAIIALTAGAVAIVAVAIVALVAISQGTWMGRGSADGAWQFVQSEVARRWSTSPEALDFPPTSDSVVPDGPDRWVIDSHVAGTIVRMQVRATVVHESGSGYRLDGALIMQP